MIVVKFGGTSMASAEQIKKACDIVLADSRRRVMVVSAPGKRFRGDVKVTDLLIELAGAKLSGQKISRPFNALMQRFAEITNGLGLKDSFLAEIEKDIAARLEKKLSKERFLDLIKAAGEDTSAKIVAAYLALAGVNAKYINPLSAGMLLSDKAGDAQILPESYSNLFRLNSESGICVFPGFFGYTKSGEVVTFSRGGSDITGAILAAAVGAERYENFTDVDHIYVADPRIIDDPVFVSEITYWQMRELAYAGFNVLHEAAVAPVVKARIPIHVKNTFNPQAAGTSIVFSRELTKREVVAIAGTGGFCNLSISKFFMNSEIGFGRRLFQILEEEGVSFDHAPSGIDNISPIIRRDQLSADKLQTLTTRIKQELSVDSIEITDDIALIVVVCETAYATKTIVAKAVRALTENDIQASMLNMTFNSLTLIIGVDEKNLNNSLKILYNEFFKDEKM